MSIKVIPGLGTRPITTEHQEGENVATLLRRLEVSVSEDEIPVMRGRAIENPEDVLVEDGVTITISTKPNNG